eukprot:3908456-Pleurochrysis_carterae.AAC.1
MAWRKAVSSSAGRLCLCTRSHIAQVGKNQYEDVQQGLIGSPMTTRVPASETWISHARAPNFIVRQT